MTETHNVTIEKESARFDDGWRHATAHCSTLQHTAAHGNTFGVVEKENVGPHSFSACQKVHALAERWGVSLSATPAALQQEDAWESLCRRSRMAGV